MDRARRAEPYSNATIWTREIARNLAGHLARISKAHSCVDTKSPKTRLLPKFQHSSKRCTTSPVKARQHHHLQQSSEQELHQSAAAKEGEEDGPEQKNDEEVDGNATPNVPQLARNEDDSGLRPIRRQRKFPKKKVREASKKSRMEADRLEIIAHENQRMQERLAKIATPNGKQHQQQSRTSCAHHPHPHSQSSDDSMWDSLEKSQSRTPYDYNKKQEQLKIWTENQVLVKRLRTAKGTLNCKEWEKDDKWNQHFLKLQEKRRIALQQELMKAQMSPLAASAVRVTKLNQHEPSIGPGTRSPSTAAVVAIVNRHDDHIEKNNKGSDTNSSNARATAANHRRIMMLRKQRSAPSKDRHGAAAAQQLGNQFETGSLPNLENRESDTDVVNVRFTFSRERRSDPAGNDDGDSLAIDPATCFGNGGQSGNLFALGAFSPAVELESALDALEMDPAESEVLISPERDDDGAGAEDDAAACDFGAEEDPDASQSQLEPSSAFADEEINVVVFDTLQDSIDLIADALSDVTEAENHSIMQVEEEECDRQPKTQEADQIVVVPSLIQDTSEIAAAVTDSPINEPDAGTTQNASESRTDATPNESVNSQEFAQATELNCDRIPRNKEIGDQNSGAAAVETVDNSEEAFTPQEGAFAADVLISPQDPQPISDTELTCIESGDDDARAGVEQEPQDPEYDEENFDDDAPPPPPEPNGDSAKERTISSDAASPVKASSSADAGDEASGYGSEFDEDQQDQQEHQEQAQQHDENLASTEKESSNPESDHAVAHSGEYEDEHYDDQYDEDEQEEAAVAAESQVANNLTGREQEQKEEELSYSDDGFSEGEDT